MRVAGPTFGSPPLRVAHNNDGLRSTPSLIPPRPGKSKGPLHPVRWCADARACMCADAVACTPTQEAWLRKEERLAHQEEASRADLRKRQAAEDAWRKNKERTVGC